MKEIYYLAIGAICASGIFLSGVYWKPIVRSLKRLNPRYTVCVHFTKKYKWRKSKLTLEQVLDLVEKRFELLDKQNASFHNRLDDHDVELDNIASRLLTKERNRKYNIRRDVREYLEELRNG